VTAWLYRAVVQAILGPVHRLVRWLTLAESTYRYFTDAPRKRRKQTVHAALLMADVEVAML